MSAVTTRSAGVDWRPYSDEALIAATRAGESDAYAELYARSFDPCQRLARRLCNGSVAAADDVVSEVFAATLRAIQNGRGPVDAFVPYVMRAVRHQVWRGLQRGDGKHADPIDPGQLDPRAADEGADEADLQVVCDALGRLPERFRLVLWWTEVEERSHREIGARLGIREPAVAAVAHRARDAFCRAYLEVRTDRALHDPCCRSTRTKLASYVRGSICDGTRRKIDAHLKACEDCAAIVDEMRRLDTSLRSVPWVGVLGTTRWAAFVERSAVFGGEVTRFVTTLAVGASLLAGPPPVTHDAAVDRTPPPAEIVVEPPDLDVGPRIRETPSPLVTRPERHGAPVPLHAPIALDPPGRIEPDDPARAGNHETKRPTTLSGGATRPGDDADGAVPIDSPVEVDPPGELVQVGVEPVRLDLGEAAAAVNVGDGLLEVQIGAGAALAHVNVADGAVDLSLGGPDALASVALGQGLVQASAAGPGGLVEVGVGDLLDVSAGGGGQAVQLSVDGLLDIGTSESAPVDTPAPSGVNLGQLLGP